MKTTSLFVYLPGLLLTFFVLSCEGPEGPQGPIGAKGDAGTQGTAGVKGDKGDAGTANVKYTEWFTPEWDEFYRSPDNLYVILNTTNSSQAILTEEAIDKSAIHVYIRYNHLLWNNADGEYELAQRVASSPSIWGYIKIPGRSSNTSVDYNQTLASYDNIGKDFFKPRLQINTNIYDFIERKENPIEEYKNQTAAQIRELAKNTAQFRIVVIPGGVLSARQKTVNFNNYSEVKEVFEMPD